MQKYDSRRIPGTSFAVEQLQSSYIAVMISCHDSPSTQLMIVVRLDSVSALPTNGGPPTRCRLVPPPGQLTRLVLASSGRGILAFRAPLRRPSSRPRSHRSQVAALWPTHKLRLRLPSAG